MTESMKIGYFPHYVNAHDDIGLQKLDAIYGLAVGYGHYFILLEQIYQEGKPILDLSDELTLQVIAKGHGWKPDKLLGFVDDCVKFGILDRDLWESERHVTSRLLCETFATMESKRNAGKAGGRPKKKAPA